METKVPMLSKRTRSPLNPVLQEFSYEGMARDWTLSGADREELEKYRTHFQLFLAVQLVPFVSTVASCTRSTNSRHALSIIWAVNWNSLPL